MAVEFFRTGYSLPQIFDADRISPLFERQLERIALPPSTSAHVTETY